MVPDGRTYCPASSTWCCWRPTSSRFSRPEQHWRDCRTSRISDANEEGLQRRIFLLGAALAGQRLHQETDLDPGSSGVTEQTHPPRASLGSAAIRAAGVRPATSSLRSTAGCALAFRFGLVAAEDVA